MKLDLIWYPGEEIQKPGTYTIRDVILSEGGPRKLILILVRPTGRVTIRYPYETFENIELVRLIKAFGDETDGWKRRSICLTVDSNGERRIDPVLLKHHSSSVREKKAQSIRAQQKRLDKRMK